MKMYNDFKCVAGHKKEYRVDSSVLVLICDICGEPATRQLAPSNFKVNGGGAYNNNFRGNK